MAHKIKHKKIQISVSKLPVNTGIENKATVDASNTKRGNKIKYPHLFQDQWTKKMYYGWVT